jgi:NAD(P)-dependent dehydrogenase (short-subunit alcohol dehydrogenase family)
MNHHHDDAMTTKTVLVTGATQGIGKATAIGLTRMGAQVAIVGRDRERTQQAGRDIEAAGASRGAGVDIFVADLASQAQVRRLADQVMSRLPRLDVLINNVGGYWSTRHVTVDGFEHTFALNYLAPYLLTRLLLDRMRDTGAARVVTVASNAQRQGRIDFADLQGERSYSGARAYSQSKLANVMFTYELARRVRTSSVTANAVHPGVVSTGFGGEDPGHLQRWLVPLFRPLMKDADQGAITSIHVASSSDLDRVTGRYFANGSPRRTSGASYDLATTARLWQVSADLVGLPVA